ncbi:hypothetical protein TcYC6_0003890 [Trypanosoma cruzi]|nr:hypothetical protein TcYC6_0003890 [Trypanosoma cruzi]
MLATVATHPQVSLGTQRILLMAAGTRRGKLGAWQPPGNSLSSKKQVLAPGGGGGGPPASSGPHGSGGSRSSCGTRTLIRESGSIARHQQQVSGLRPPSLDEKQSGGTTECPPKPEEAQPSGTTRHTDSEGPGQMP